MRSVSLGVALVAVLAGCIPVRETRTARDVVVSWSEHTYEPQPRRDVELAVNLSTRVVSIHVERKRDCRHVRVESVETRTEVTRDTSGTPLVVTYLAAAAMVGLGAIVLADAPNVAAESDPLLMNPVGRDGAYGIGAGLCLGAAIPLTIALTASARAVDDEEVSERRAREVVLEPIRCGTDFVDAEVVIEVREGNAFVERRVVGETEAGELEVDLVDALGPTLLRPGRAIRVAVSGASVEINSDRLAAVVEEAQWSQPMADIESLRQFIAWFPNSVHAAEAAARLRTAVRTALDVAVAAERDLAAQRAAYAASPQGRREAAAAARAATDQAAAHAALEREANRVQRLLQCHLWREPGHAAEWYDARHPAGQPTLKIWVSNFGRASGAWDVFRNETLGWVALGISTRLGEALWRVLDATAEAIVVQAYDIVTGTPTGRPTTLSRIDAEFPRFEPRAAPMFRECRAAARRE